MPVSKAMLLRYPENWPELREAVLRRAGDRCEWCGAKNGEPHPKTGSRVVLTTAHVYDHRPEAANLRNLAALCQKCHLGHDRHRHIHKPPVPPVGAPWPVQARLDAVLVKPWFDIDGTLLEGRPDFGSPESVRRHCTPIVKACEAVRGLIESGVRVGFVSMRTEVLRGVTLEQLHAHVHPGIRSTDVVLQKQWFGYRVGCMHKARALRERGATHYFGDIQEDREASDLAGCQFTHATALAEGVLPW